MPRIKYVQVENKNALLELLQEGRSFERIYLASNAYKDPKTKAIITLATEKKIPIEKVARREIGRRSNTSSSESVIGLMHMESHYDLSGLIDDIFQDGKDPFFLVFNDIQYAQNVGAIFRTAFAAGVNGVITPIQKGNLLSDEVIRISMGTCLRIPIVEMNIFTAIKELKKNAIEVIGVDMEGSSMYEADLTGPKAFLLGSEYMGITSKLEERADTIVSIPMREGLGSLNVGIASAIIMYEKLRQDTFLKNKKF